MLEKRTIYRNRAAVLAIAIFGGACRTVSTSPEVVVHQGTPEMLAQELAEQGLSMDRVVVLAGRIDGRDVREIGGSSIQVYRIHNDGKLQLLSVEKTQSDDDGKYQAPVMLPEEPTDLLVISKTEGLRGYGTVMVPSWSVVDSVIIAPPISLETRVETDVYFAAVEAGIWPENLGATEIRKVINDRLASQLRRSENYDQDVLIMAHAAVGAIHSWYKILLGSEAGLEPQKIQAVLEALGWAQVALDAQLYAAANSNDEENAFAVYDVAVKACYAGIGVGPEQLAVAAQASADTLRKYATAMSDASRPMLLSEAEHFRAKYVTNAVEALFVRAGASETEREAVKTAGTKLEGMIKSAPGEKAAEVDDFLRNAWSEYRQAVQGKLEKIAAKVGEVVI